MVVQVRVALEAETSDGLNIAALAFETGLSMEWVTDLCSTPLFYHRWGEFPARACLGGEEVFMWCRSYVWMDVDQRA